jgi:predicted MFS family arabinose efflux permease
MPLDVAGAGLLAAATAAFVLVCVSIGEGSAWTSARVLGLAGATVAAGGLLVRRERRAADPIVPLDLLRTRTVAVSSAALFLATASLFAVTVFVPLFLQTTTGATPTEAGLLLVPMMGGIVLSTNVVGHAISRTGRYRRYPLLGLGLMAGALVLMAVVASDPSRTTTGAALAVFGIGFGMVGQVLTTAVQNAVEQRQLGVAMATTSFFRGLGGAVGAAALGAVFAAQAGASSAGDVSRADVIDGVQLVFLVAAPLAALGLLVALALRETPLAGRPSTPGSNR